MMNPEMMKLAMEQMNRMTPEQIAAVQKQMAGMDPAAMQARQPPLLIDLAMHEYCLGGGTSETRVTVIPSYTNSDTKLSPGLFFSLIEKVTHSLLPLSIFSRHKWHKLKP
jgi:hypothetical protein